MRGLFIYLGPHLISAMILVLRTNSSFPPEKIKWVETQQSYWTLSGPGTASPLKLHPPCRAVATSATSGFSSSSSSCGLCLAFQEAMAILHKTLLM